MFSCEVQGLHQGRAYLPAEFPKWHRAWCGVLVCISVAILTNTHQEQCGGERVCASYRTPSLREAKARTQAPTMEHESSWNGFTWLARKTFYFSFIAQAICPPWYHLEWCPTDMPTGQCDKGNFSFDFPLPKLVSVCLKTECGYASLLLKT